MRSYGQNCALAKALDVLGDRWTLLIVRELMIRGACRYTDLRNGLPGIATNLLAERLKEMEASGLVEREEAAPPIATTLFQLTKRGCDIEAIISELGRWGAPLLANKDAGDAFCDHWIALPLRLYVGDLFPKQGRMQVNLRIGKEWMTLETVGDGSIRTHFGEAREAVARIEGSGQQILALLMHKISWRQAAKNGLHIAGEKNVLTRLGPRPAAIAT